METEYMRVAYPHSLMNGLNRIEEEERAEILHLAITMAKEAGERYGPKHYESALAQMEKECHPLVIQRKILEHQISKWHERRGYINGR